MEGNIVYSFEKVPVNSSLTLHLCLCSILGRGSGIVPCSDCYWDLANQKYTIQKFQKCFPLSFWGISQMKDCLILGTLFYCHHFHAWLLNCMSVPAHCCSQLPLLLTGNDSKILVFHTPVDSGLILCFRSFLWSCLLFVTGR